ncbi:MAG TPA: c-type cytochrome [Acidobacteriaceae bacterium]|nr:c-type cytochrome [Acidobacteriaceae bacterium]
MRASDKIRNSWRALFRDPIRPFGVASIFLLMALAIAPAKDHFSEWRQTQSEYLRFIRNRPENVTLQRHFRPGIQQVWLPDAGVVDRCQTCHLGLAESSLGDVKTRPFGKHPPIPHSLTEFGCVVCHRGQGVATTVAEAHDSTLAPAEPLLPARYMEASCGQCHHAALAGTPKLNQGRIMLARYGCVRCHTVKLPDGSTMMPTDDPPPLTHIAEKTSREWIYAWLKDPQSYSTASTMPNFQLSDADARDISAFLIANSVPVPNAAPRQAPAKADAAAEPTAGASLYGQSFCASCHATQNAAGTLAGGDLGPELTAIGTKVKPEWLRAWLRDPHAYNPATPMPRYRWTDQQLDLLTGFLENKTNSDFVANVHLDAATPEQITHGKQLVNEYGCAVCHEIRGMRKPDNFAPDLSRMGSKPLAQLVFTAGMPHTLPDYLAGKIQHPRAFGPGLRMPQYTFTSAQVDSLSIALLSLTDRSFTMPPQWQVASTKPSTYQAAGHAGRLMTDLNCQACHRINGRGGDMAPDLTAEGSSVQRQWLNDFLKNPNTLRPALIRRMPRFNLTDNERAELTDYIMTVYQIPDVEPADMALSGYAPALVEQGRQLFYSKYGCQGCHMVDPSQDKGYIGPPLTAVGSRLTAACIYAYLKNPQALRPGTIEPNREMSDGDARALTAFLMAQKGSGKQEAKR